MLSGKLPEGRNDPEEGLWSIYNIGNWKSRAWHMAPNMNLYLVLTGSYKPSEPRQERRQVFPTRPNKPQ